MLAMKLFKCQACAQLLYFENRRCERCARRLGYLPDKFTLSALEPQGEDWLALASRDEVFRFCANAEHDACNWLVPTSSEEQYCIACRHNRTIPPIDEGQNLLAWRKLELAKHRLFYALQRLNLPLTTRKQDPDGGLAFDFLASAPDNAAAKVVTGHHNGLITIAAEETDDAARELLRQQMGETYRTTLGHLRHEIGHYYWSRLVQEDKATLERFRTCFGDERADYAQALQAYYANGPAADWQDRFVSAYASAHPWEDFAETWAHYLHIVDTLETASAFGLHIAPSIDAATPLEARLDFDPYRAADIGRLIDAWLPLTFAVNSLNRSMGQSDLYPFVLSQPAIEKLGFVHALVRARSAARKGGGGD
jgi:hypothetical protein